MAFAGSPHFGVRIAAWPDSEVGLAICNLDSYSNVTMPSYTYLAREAGTGREIRSSIDATSEQAAIAALLNRNLLVVSIQEKIGKKGRTGGGKVALADLVVFTRQLATMVDAGLAMVQSLQALAEQTTNKVMRDVIRDVCTRVESGDKLVKVAQREVAAGFVEKLENGGTEQQS